MAATGRQAAYSRGSQHPPRQCEREEGERATWCTRPIMFWLWLWLCWLWYASPYGPHCTFGPPWNAICHFCCPGAPKMVRAVCIPNRWHAIPCESRKRILTGRWGWGNDDNDVTETRIPQRRSAHLLIAIWFGIVKQKKKTREQENDREKNEPFLLEPLKLSHCKPIFLWQNSLQSVFFSLSFRFCPVPSPFVQCVLAMILKLTVAVC